MGARARAAADGALAESARGAAAEAAALELAELSAAFASGERGERLSARLLRVERRLLEDGAAPAPGGAGGMHGALGRAAKHAGAALQARRFWASLLLALALEAKGANRRDALEGLAIKGEERPGCRLVEALEHVGRE